MKRHVLLQLHLFGGTVCIWLNWPVALYYRRTTGARLLALLRFEAVARTRETYSRCSSRHL